MVYGFGAHEWSIASPRSEGEMSAAECVFKEGRDAAETFGSAARADIHQAIA